MCMPEEMKERLLNAQETMIEQVGECIMENADEILELNKKKLYEEGLDKNDKPLRPYADAYLTHATHLLHESYAEMKNKMNPLPGYGQPDLYLTGEFQSGFVLKIEGENYEITSTDSKTDILTSKGKHGYTDNIFGLDEQDKETAWEEYLMPSYREKLRDQLQA